MSSAVATPTSSDAANSAVAVKSDAADNSDTTKISSPTKANKKNLTPREDELFKIAMTHCLKSGAVEIDMDKFIEHGKFQTKKTAQNMWGTIKNKIFPKKEAVAGEIGDATPRTPKTPKAKAAATPRKRTKKAADEDGDDEEVAGEAVDSVSPKKKARKSPVKKTPKVVAQEDAVTALVEATQGADEEETAPTVKAEANNDE